MAWDVDGLITLSKGLPRKWVRIADLGELDTIECVQFENDRKNFLTDSTCGPRRRRSTHK